MKKTYDYSTFLKNTDQILKDVRSMPVSKAERAEIPVFAAWLKSQTNEQRLAYWTSHCGKPPQPSTWMWLHLAWCCHCARERVVSE
jgi:hypothetical protein